MRFNPRARLDTSQVRVRRGGGRSGGVGFPVPSRRSGRVSGMRAGGGLGGLLVLVLVVVLNGGLGGLVGGSDGAAPPRSAVEPVAASELTECRTGADANRNPDCARLAVVNSLQAFWSQTLPAQSAERYRRADTVMFSDQVSTGCGQASSAVGPFYCPVDQTVYLDTTFFDDVLEGRLGAAGGDFAEAYVLAHEYGHHVQNLLGYLGRTRTQSGPESDAVRLELMADCLAGMWTRFATLVPDATGQLLIEELDDQDIEEALDAARAVGDDRIQRESGVRVDPDRWTHGSAAAREWWFDAGYARGSLEVCDTFEAADLDPTD